MLFFRHFPANKFDFRWIPILKRCIEAINKEICRKHFLFFSSFSNTRLRCCCQNEKSLPNIFTSQSFFFSSISRQLPAALKLLGILSIWCCEYQISTALTENMSFGRDERSPSIGKSILNSGILRKPRKQKQNANNLFQHDLLIKSTLGFA